MNALLSAVASDLVSRLVSFLVGRYQDPGATNDAVRLQRALLRARVVVEEAEGRQIANRAMLLQLSQLRRELCRAAYALDAFRCRAVDPGKSTRSHATASRSRSHTRRPPSSDGADVLSVTVESLEAALSDMREFVVLLGSCPRVTRQPYSAYLFVESCMFGRQMEKEEIIGFLLSSQPSHREDHLDVLPIVGPHGVGKRTLVEHVCLDERVRERFAKVHRLSSSELDLHHESLVADVTTTTTRSLIVIDVADGEEESWRRFHSAVRRRGVHSSGSKVIVISRAEKARSSSGQLLLMGTVAPLRLRAPRRDELWYLFRALAFGAADPDDRPDLAHVAMALCARVCGYATLARFAAVSIVAASLRADMSARAWRRVLKVYADAKVVQLGGGAAGYYYPCGPCLFYNRRELSGGVARSELPKVTMTELLAGGSLPPAGEARFDVLMWQSRIPPYGSYVLTCDVERARQVVAAGEKQAPARKRRRDRHLTDTPAISEEHVFD